MCVLKLEGMESQDHQQTYVAILLKSGEQDQQRLVDGGSFWNGALSVTNAHESPRVGFLTCISQCQNETAYSTATVYWWNNKMSVNTEGFDAKNGVMAPTPRGPPPPRFVLISSSLSLFPLHLCLLSRL